MFTHIDCALRSTKSTRKGNFGFKNLNDGTHDLEIKRPGYKTILLNIATVKAETLKLNIMMEPQTTNPDQ